MVGDRVCSKCLAAIVLGVLAFSGCAMLRPIQPSPWMYSQQHEAILEIAPLGTPRDETIARLTESGIAGSFGLSETIYYCDIWNRPDGPRWHLNVALYFDPQGNLYDIRPGQAETGAFNGSMATENPSDNELPQVYGTAAGRRRAE